MKKPKQKVSSQQNAKTQRFSVFSREELLQKANRHPRGLNENAESLRDQYSKFYDSVSDLIIAPPEVLKEATEFDLRLKEIVSGLEPFIEHDRSYKSLKEELKHVRWLMDFSERRSQEDPDAILLSLRDIIPRLARLSAAILFLFPENQFSNELQTEAKIKKKTRTKRTTGEPTKPKQVNFPQSMAADLKAAADARGESLSKWVVDACAERLQSEGGGNIAMIPLPGDLPKDLRSKIEDMAIALSKVVVETMDRDPSEKPEEGHIEPE